MKNSGLIIATLSALGLFAYLTLAEPRFRRTDDGEDSLIFPSLIETPVTAISFARSATPPWELTSTPDAPRRFSFSNRAFADEAQTDLLLRALVEAQFSRNLGSASPPSDATKTLTLTLKAEKRASYVLELYSRAQDKVARGAYACASEGTSPKRCGILPSSLTELLEKPRTAYLNHRLLPWPPREVEQIAVTIGSDEFRATRGESGFVSGAKEPLERGALEEGLRNLADQKLLRPAETRSPSPLGKLQLRKKSGELHSVSFGKGCGDSDTLLSAEFDSGDRYCVPESTLFLLKQLRPGLDRHLTTMRADELDHLTLRGPAGKLEVIRKDADFLMMGPSPSAVDRSRGQELFALVSEAEGEILPQIPNLRFDFEWVFQGIGGGSDQPVNEKVQAAFDSERVVVRRGEVFLTFHKHPLFTGEETELASLKVLQFSPRDVIRLSRSTNGQPPSTLFSSQTGIYPQIFEELVRTLSHLEAERFEPPSAPNARSPLVAYEIELKGSSEPLLLTLERRLLAGYLARTNRTSRPFFLAREVGALLLQDPRLLGALDGAPESVSAVEVETPEGKLVLRRRGPNWDQTPARSLPNPDEFVAHLFELRGSAAVRASKRSSPLLKVRLQKTLGDADELAILERFFDEEKAFYFLTSSAQPLGLVVEARLIEPLLAEL